MAYVILTTDEKAQLAAFPRFQNAVRQAVLDQAAYWRGQNGTNIADATAAQRWRKSRDYAEKVIASPQELNNQQTMVISQFMVFMKNMPVHDDAGAFNADTITTYLSNNGGGVSLSALADAYFDQQILTQP